MASLGKILLSHVSAKYQTTCYIRGMMLYALLQALVRAHTVPSSIFPFIFTTSRFTCSHKICVINICVFIFIIYMSNCLYKHFVLSITYI